MKRAFSAVALALVAGGCSPEGITNWSNRYGPDPGMPGEAVRTSAYNQALLHDAFASAIRSPRTEADRYYQITLNGFNFVNEQCDAYLRELFVLDQERNRLKKGLDATALLTNAVLATTPASKASMAVVAQAFGLSSQFADTATNSYLFGVNTSTIFNVVNALQIKYRIQTESVASKITSWPAAYSQIRGYLQLCMPPTIEGKINELIAAKTAEPKKQAEAAAKAGAKSQAASQSVSLAQP